MLIGGRTAAVMQATLAFDVEDPITPESDDVALWLAEILTEEGATGTFFVTGAKARALEERGRKDVIDALAEHDIAYHSNTHSVHPTISEYLADCGWREGIERVIEVEEPGIDDVERIFGVRPRSFGRSGGSYAPQFVAGMAELGLAYAYSPIEHPTTAVTRFAGGLTFGDHTPGFDHVLADAEEFPQRFEDFKRNLTGHVGGGRDFLFVFVAHPSRVRATEFWDIVNFANGRNPPESAWKTPPLRPASSMETAKDHYRQLVRFCRDTPALDLTTVSSLIDEYESEVESLRTAQLVEIAMRAASSREISIDQPFSPGETILAFCEALLHVAETGELPRQVARKPVFGPSENPPTAPMRRTADLDELTEAARIVVEIVERDSKLPTQVQIDGCRMGIGSLYFALAEGIITQATQQDRGQIALPARDQFPAIARDIAVDIPDTLAGWGIHDRDLDPRRITDHTIRQTWTMKPAGTGQQ